MRQSYRTCQEKDNPARTAHIAAVRACRLCHGVCAASIDMQAKSIPVKCRSAG